MDQETSAAIARHRTAIVRTELSRPVRLALEAGQLRPGQSFFDFGCGKGHDVERVATLGFEASGWDPKFRPAAAIESSDVVNLGYVLNVIESPIERAEVLWRAWRVARHLLVIAVRLQLDARGTECDAFGDGCITSRATFQKFFRAEEAREWIERTLSVQPVSAAPGVYFVFRHEEARQGYIESTLRRQRAAPRARISDRLFDANRDILEPLMSFVADRGRLPCEAELPAAAELRRVFGSVKSAFATVRRVTGAERWTEMAAERRTELLIYLALGRLKGRPPFGALPETLQLDIKALFSNYTRAGREADELLYSAGRMQKVEEAMRASKIGKITGSALYVHRDALPELPAILRVYEGCARAYVGMVERANVVKLSHIKPQVSYLWYPEFDEDPHPELLASLKVSLGQLDVSYRRYGDRGNPPVLHRREDFLGAGDVRREEFKRITEDEEAQGLYEDPSRIGTRLGWQEVLQGRGVALRRSGGRWVVVDR